ncbi:MAG: GEVED domain-containing protein [Chloroflexota bacterium]
MFFYLPSGAAPAHQIQPKVCQNFDIVYLLDLSGSMSWSYEGTGSRLDAAKSAIIAMNDVLIEEEEGVRASLITWQHTSSSVAVDFTSDFDSISTVVYGLNASGTTPTAKAMQGVRQHLQNNYDPDRQQIILLITDGIPTRDLDGYYYHDPIVSDVPIVQNPGSPSDQYTYYDSSTVRTSGEYFDHGRYAGHPLADAMDEIDFTVSSLSDVTIHSIAILGTDFRQDLLYYAAAQGGGEYFGASTANQLAGSIQQAVYEGDCQSSLSIDVDNTETFTIGGQSKTIDPELSVSGNNEDIKSATVEIVANHDPQHDTLFIGDQPADSGSVEGLSWWLDGQTGNLQIVGIGTPEAYQAVLRQVKFYNSAESNTATHMGTRTIRFTIDSAIPNTAPTDNLYDDGFMQMVYVSGIDYSDGAPSYGNATHSADMFFRLGETVDVEGSSLATGNASGDDTSQADDEDGVIFANSAVLKRGAVNQATITYLNKNKNTAYLQMWIDLDRNGVFDAYDDITSDQVTLNKGSDTQTFDLSFVIPGDAVCGDTTARIRLTTEPVGAATANPQVKGEVEDYMVVISCEPPIDPEPTYDYGDAPAEYGNPSHTIISGMYLGEEVDAEASPMYSFDASGDDKTGSDDEDGVIFPEGATGILGDDVQYQINAFNSAYLQAYVNAWVDWNQNDIFEANEQIMANEVVPRGSTASSFSRRLTIPFDAACHETYMRVRLSGSPVDATSAAVGGETEDYLFDVSCDADLSIEVIPTPDPVRLEETLVIQAFAKNAGPNFANWVTATVSLPPAIDIQSTVSNNGWTCSLSGDQLNMSCTKPVVASETNELMFEVQARIPGIFPVDAVNGSGQIESSFPDPDQNNNSTTYFAAVDKVWTGDGVPYSAMTYFTHALFDESLAITGDNENDFMADEIVQNPFQVPLQILPALELNSPPTLMAEYCTEIMTDGCKTSDANITGTIKVTTYTIDTLIMQEVDDSNQKPTDLAGATNLVSAPFTINYGLSGQGRYLDKDLGRCTAWIAGYETGNCQAQYNTFKLYGDQSQYEWASSEYVELVFQSTGGRTVECSNTVGHCLNITDARPGIYRLSGTIDGKMIFNDPMYDRIGEAPTEIPFSYPVTIYVRIVSSFTEPNQ